MLRSSDPSGTYNTEVTLILVVYSRHNSTRAFFVLVAQTLESGHSQLFFGDLAGQLATRGSSSTLSVGQSIGSEVPVY